MTLRFYFVRETDLARLYMDTKGLEYWFPKSVIKSTVKFPAKSELDMAVHEIVVEDWFWESKQDDEYFDKIIGDAENESRN